MGLKPGTICQLEKDKFVGGQEGFVDTFNWMASAANNVRGEGGIVVDTTVSDFPVIRLGDDEYEAKEVDVVTDMRYDLATRQFMATRMKIKALVKRDAITYESHVFTAVPI